jgi:hypothetical protein
MSGIDEDEVLWSLRTPDSGFLEVTVNPDMDSVVFTVCEDPTEDKRYWQYRCMVMTPEKAHELMAWLTKNVPRKKAEGGPGE